MPSRASKSGHLHHVEIYVSDLERSRQFWGWLLSELGYEEFQSWKSGFSFKLDETYIVFVHTEEKYLKLGYHRCSTGLNHLAFHASSIVQIDAIRSIIAQNGWHELYPERFPYAGGIDYYALFFEDPDRIKVELVLSQEPLVE